MQIIDYLENNYNNLNIISTEVSYMYFFFFKLTNHFWSFGPEKGNNTDV